MEPKKEFIEGTLQERRVAFLNDTASFYNSSNRCVDIKNYCQYSATEDSPGCAIGRWLEPTIAQNLDKSWDVETFGASVGCTDVFDQLPEWMQDLGQDFLRAVQSLHDNSEHWSLEGLTAKGIDFIATIKSIYKLD